MIIIRNQNFDISNILADILEKYNILNKHWIGSAAKIRLLKGSIDG